MAGRLDERRAELDVPFRPRRHAGRPAGLAESIERALHSSVRFVRPRCQGARRREGLEHATQAVDLLERPDVGAPDEPTAARQGDNQALLLQKLERLAEGATTDLEFGRKGALDEAL